MKKEELKKVLKPLIKECIKEVMFEDGTLSTIIAEVAVGLGASSKQQIVETKRKDPQVFQERRKRDVEKRKKLLDAIGKESYNGVDLFEGTTPIRSSPSSQSSRAPGPLSDIDPRDPGVDLSNFMGAEKLWKKAIGN